MADPELLADWLQLSSRWYRKRQIYVMEWEHIDLGQNKVACAPFGGPIAVISDDHPYAESLLQIFNSAGVQLSQTVWKHSGGRIIGMGWTDNQTLVCVVQDGTIHRYTIHAEHLEPSISIGELNVMECVFWGKGMVCITEAKQLFWIADFQIPNPTKLADPGIKELPTCMAVIDPQYTKSGRVEVLLGVSGKAYVAMVNDHRVEKLGVGILWEPLQKIVVSPDGRWVASFTERDGTLLVTDPYFTGFITDRWTEVGFWSCVNYFLSFFLFCRNY